MLTLNHIKYFTNAVFLIAVCEILADNDQKVTGYRCPCQWVNRKCQLWEHFIITLTYVVILYLIFLNGNLFKM